MIDTPDAGVVREIGLRYGLGEPAHHNPPMGFDRDPAAFAAAVAFVLAHPARFVFLAVGSPRLEGIARNIASGKLQAAALTACEASSQRIMSANRCLRA